MLNRQEILVRFSELATQEHLLSVRVTPFYEAKITEEIAAVGYEGPLYRGAYPTEERLTVRAPGEVPDFVQDHSNMPKGLKDVVIQKYPDRMLFLPTDHCAGHCQYCFRTYVLTQEHEQRTGLPDFERKLEGAIGYVNDHPSITEVIFSGGDPMTLRPEMLETAIRRFREETAIRDIRIHTRTIVFSPGVFRDRVNEVLGKYDVRVVFHIMHPYEICDAVADTIRHIQSFGIRTYNQFPLLRKINDHPNVIIQHLRLLDDLRVRQLSMFIPDPINYSASFRIPLRRLFSLLDEVNWKSSAWINSSRVVLDTQIGKVRRENIVSWNTKTGIVTFEREGQRIEYRDFPEELDIPGDISKLLWKDSSVYGN